MIQDEAARELLALRGERAEFWPHLVAYLGCFRSKSRSLSWSRALKLAREVMAIGADPRALAAALDETVESMRQKRDQGDVRPLKNHNYLQRVLESVGSVGAGLPVGAQHAAPPPAARRGGRSGMATAEGVLAEWAGSDWLRVEIGHGLLALLALPLYKAPEAGSIDRTASLWERELRRIGTPVETVDRARINTAFSSLLSMAKERFPEPAAIWDHMPRRAEQKKLDVPLSAEEVTAGRQTLREFLKEG